MTARKIMKEKKNYISKAQCYFLGQHTRFKYFLLCMLMRNRNKGRELTELRSFRPAPRVNFLAKRKQGAGFSLLVHHSFLYSVS
jgi:hypothetical protein